MAVFAPKLLKLSMSIWAICMVSTTIALLSTYCYYTHLLGSNKCFVEALRAIQAFFILLKYKSNKKQPLMKIPPINTVKQVAKNLAVGAAILGLGGGAVTHIGGEFVGNKALAKAGFNVWSCTGAASLGCIMLKNLTDA
jgi:hypothetical protein